MMGLGFKILCMANNFVFQLLVSPTRQLLFTKKDKSSHCWENASKAVKRTCNNLLVGGFNPSEKYLVKLGSSSPNRDERKKYLKPPPIDMVSWKLWKTFDADD